MADENLAVPGTVSGSTPTAATPTTRPAATLPLATPAASPLPSPAGVPVTGGVAERQTATPGISTRAQLRPVNATVITGEERRALEEDKRARWQEWVRAATTGCFLFLLLILIVFSCYEAQSWKEHWAQTKEMLQIILPALTGLLGSSLGFYFGSRDRSSANSTRNASTPVSAPISYQQPKPPR
jgi:hypothetical protein